MVVVVKPLWLLPLLSLLEAGYDLRRRCDLWRKSGCLGHRLCLAVVGGPGRGLRVGLGRWGPLGWS